MMQKIFESEKYNAVMFILISFAVLLIVFNLIGIVENINDSKIFFGSAGKPARGDFSESGFAVKEINQTVVDETEVYTEKSYAVYYFIMTGLIVVILFLTASLILPRVKKYT